MKRKLRMVICTFCGQPLGESGIPGGFCSRDCRARFDRNLWKARAEKAAQEVVDLRAENKRLRERLM